MMPDRYDELRKRLLVSQDQPQIDYNQAVDDSGIPIDRVPAQVEPVATPESRRDLQAKADTNRALANAIVAAGSSLTGFMGGTATEQSSRFNQSNKYLQNIASLEADKLKKLKEIKNEAGQPEFIAESNAIGMEPYHAPLKPVAGSLISGMLMKGQPAKFINKETGDVISLAVGPDNVVRRLGHQEPFDLTDKWVPHEGYSTPSGVDVFGSKTTDIVAKAAPNIKRNAKSTQGLGSYMGGIPLEEAKSRLKEAAKGKEKVAESLAIIGELEASEKKLSKTNDAMTFSIGVGQALRTVEKRLSEDEQKRFMGDSYRSVFQNAENYLQGKMGIIPPNIREGVLEAIKYLKQKEQGKVKSNQKSYSSAEGLNKKGLETVKRTSGQDPKQPTESNDWRSNLKGMYR